MVYEKITLDENSYITVYKSNRAKNYPAMLVIPGGAYGGISEGEGEPVALSYLSKGFTAFVLNYSVYPNTAKAVPLVEASKAIAYIKRNAESYGVDKNRVYAIGFSAGGHLTASLATLWHKSEIIEKAEIEYGENKPTAVVLCYPVVSGTDYPHFPSFQNLLAKKEPSREELEYYSLEKQVDERSVPAFIIHTAEDTIVPVQNSLMLAKAYADAKVQLELHVYPHGDHGYSLGNVVSRTEDGKCFDTQYARFVDDSVYFFEHLK